ncbi:hypothetical protein F4804DRAFT_348474 [Jackrogersella minutella]|nr:hypothetical protein F4804DRAFT_348474 [Jackrogersella minutella]
MPRTQSSAGGNHKCNKCSYETNTLINLGEHRRCTHVGTRCAWPDCGVQTQTEVELRMHINMIHCTINQCQTMVDGQTKARFKCTWPTCTKIHSFLLSALYCGYSHVYSANISEVNQRDQSGDYDEAEDRDRHESYDEHGGEFEPEKEVEIDSFSDLDSTLECELELDIEESGSYVQESSPTMSVERKLLRAISSLLSIVKKSHGEFAAKLDIISDRIQLLGDLVANMSDRVDDLEFVIYGEGSMD